ncbi:hypothetical protein CkaCkLH20_10996 [Colletotrichum karsti]|uniref:Uncharacterized protein n=1 Tax=Colletotrichum karsti TaxID=1095194 RepID=A0A9P6I447_9PEZI|nr:uncharacterized protein CkaCkLH20_10996 [Colletotrichum karsti]KAF9871585.1 hypothetical protein CkaCkLH20_10996 [Colletotrichum karsti]
MRSFVTCTVLASVASLATATLQARWEYPEAVPVVEKRQEPGTPRYACHENCGLLISLGRTEGYCQKEEWSTRYSACMSCANEFGIWMYYSNGVTNAAKGCGLTPVPSPSGGAAETTAAAATTTAAAPATTSAAAEVPATTSTSAAAAPPAGESSSAAAAPSTTTAAGAATTLTTATSAASASASGSAASGTSAATSVTRTTSIGTSVVIPSGSPTPSTVFAGASKNTGVLGAVGVVGLVLAAL